VCALFAMRRTCYVLCRLNSNSRMYFALKLQVSPCPCPYSCLEGLVLVLVLVLGGSVLVNITGWHCARMITSGRRTHLSRLVTIRPLEVATRIHELYTSCDFLPPFFLLRTCAGQTDRANFTHNGSKDAVWRKKVPSQPVYFSHLTFWMVNLPPKPPTFRPQ